jgi:predicted MPP superfamily phosphohydrolase
MLSIIPDIHADPRRLDSTLAKVDRSSKLAFLGDLIDAGDGVENPSDRQVLLIARGLIDCGRAVGIMGNHELNAVLFHRSGPNSPLRQHSEKNRYQHNSFIESFGDSTTHARTPIVRSTRSQRASGNSDGPTRSLSMQTARSGKLVWARHVIGPDLAPRHRR